MRIEKLAPKTARYGPVPGGGLEDWTASDIAAALAKAGLEGAAADALRAKYCAEVAAGRRLLKRLSDVLMTTRPTIIRQKIELGPLDSGDARILAAAVLWTYLLPDICWTCNGGGGRIVEDKWLPCRRCKATGIAPWTDRELSMFLNVSVEVWRKRLVRQYDDALARVQHWERQGKSAVRWQLIS